MAKHTSVGAKSVHGAQVAVVHVVEEATVEVVAGFQPVGDQGQTRAPMRPPIARKLFHNGAAHSPVCCATQVPFGRLSVSLYTNKGGLLLTCWSVVACIECPNILLCLSGCEY